MKTVGYIVALRVVAGFFAAEQAFQSDVHFNASHDDQH